MKQSELFTSLFKLHICAFFIILFFGLNANAQSCSNPLPISPELGTACSIANNNSSTVLLNNLEPNAISNHCYSFVGNNIWYYWVADKNGIVFNTGNGSPGIAIFDANTVSCSGLQNATNYICSSTFFNGIVDGWQIGDSLLINIYDFNDANSAIGFCIEAGNIGCTDATALNYDSFAEIDDGSCYTLPNSICSGAIPYPITIDPTGGCANNTYVLNNSQATNTTDIVPSCDLINNIGQWFSFTATSTGIEFVTGNGEAGLSIYSGSCTNPTEIGCLDNVSGSVFGLIPGNQYFVYIFDDSFGVSNLDFCINPINSGCTDSLAFNYDPIAQFDDGFCYYAENDICTGAIPFPYTISGVGTCSALNFDFSVFNDNGLDPTCDIGGDAVAWYTFIATENSISFDNGISFANNCELGIEILDPTIGDCNGGFASIGCLNNFSGNILGLIPGQEYYLILWDDEPLPSPNSCDICIEQVTSGCNIPIAFNYDPQADINDGSCVFPGSNCANSIVLAGCSDTIYSDTVYNNVNGVVATNFNGSKWYVFEAPGNGTLELNFISALSLNENNNPESFVHDIGPGMWSTTLADSIICSNVNPNGIATQNLGDQYSTNTAVVAGNIYAIEIGNNWTNTKFDWTWSYSCEAINGLNFLTATDSTALIEYSETLTNGDSILATISYVNQNNGSQIVLNNQSSPIVLSGLSPGTSYSFCLSYACDALSNCNSTEVCQTFNTSANCTAPIADISPVCTSDTTISLNVEVTNAAAFTNITNGTGNVTGFSIFVDEGTGFYDSGSDVVQANTSVNVLGPFASASLVKIQLIGNDNPNCPSPEISLNLAMLIECAEIEGCTDPTACNYDPAASVENGTCDFGLTTCLDPCAPVYGCTDAAACNYIPAACLDDGSCILGNQACPDPCNQTVGCTNAIACNYDPSACVDNGSCIFGYITCPNPCNLVLGCSDINACNYDPNVCIDNNSCNYGNPACTDPCNPITGCTDADACNYNPSACIDNGSCDLGFLTCSDPCSPAFGCTIVTACNYNPFACVNDGSCIIGTNTCPDPCNVILGCTNPIAPNYDPIATCEDGSCDLLIGCSDDVLNVAVCDDPNGQICFNLDLGANDVYNNPDTILITPPDTSLICLGQIPAQFNNSAFIGSTAPVAGCCGSPSANIFLNAINFSGGASIDEQEYNSSHTGGPDGIKFGMFGGPGTNLETVYAFDQEVCNFSFTLYDIDNEDIITVTGSNSNGANIPFTVTSLGTEITDNNPSFENFTNGSTSGTVPQEGWVQITFNGCISGLTFDFTQETGGTGGSFTFVPNVDVCDEVITPGTEVNCGMLTYALEANSPNNITLKGSIATICVDNSFVNQTLSFGYSVSDDCVSVSGQNNTCVATASLISAVCCAGGADLNDLDCDGVPGTIDCDDNDPNITTTNVNDMDCDGVVTAEDCDDLNPYLGSNIDDADCDGIFSFEDCDDNDPTIINSNVPFNDNCIDATNLIVDVVSNCNGIIVPYSNFCASVQNQDPVGSCFNGANNANVWFSFVAPDSGEVRISTDYQGGNLTNTEMALFEGSCGNLIELSCNQNGGQVVFANSIIDATGLTAGNTYYILVDRWSTSSDGSFCIDVIDTNPEEITCAQVLNLSGSVSSGTYVADDVILSNAQITGASSGPVFFEAGANSGGQEYIELTIGFYADGSHLFMADNVQCNFTD